MAKLAHRRFKGYPERASYPWYDSQWLESYVTSKSYLARRYPGHLDLFEERMAALRIDPAFKPVQLDSFLDAGTLERVRSIVADCDVENLETHEYAAFGRDVVHDHPVLLQIQEQIRDQVGGIVGEPLDNSYNFLSLYRGLGHCPVHMDAPDAKWTLDICIDQSKVWPIHFSDVVPWPEDWIAPADGDWEASITDAATFTSYTMEPGQAIVFGGSSQWHYRDRMEAARSSDFCTLLFFHFVPRGARSLTEPKAWAEVFGIDDLRHVI